MKALALYLLLGLAACTATTAPTPVATRVDADGFLYFNDAALYRSAMRRCAGRSSDFASELASAERVFADARNRYVSRGGNPDRADLTRIYARSDRELAADFARQSDAETAAACVRLAAYHRRNTAAYASS